MYAIFVTGTAGSGKSMISSMLRAWYEEKGSHAIIVNLDPGAENLPYTPDVDIREHVSIPALMRDHMLGPNGAQILAADLIADRLPEIQDDIDGSPSEYAIIDTAGQIELFAYRPSGPYIVKELRCDDRAILFLFDPSLVSSATNFVAVAFLASSIRLRLGGPLVGVLSKRDLFEKSIPRIMNWAGRPALLEQDVMEESGGTHYLLASGLLRKMVSVGLAHQLFPVSAVTREGAVELFAALSRILKGGEEVED